MSSPPRAIAACWGGSQAGAGTRNASAMHLSLTLAPAHIPRNKLWASEAMRPAGATGPKVNVRDVESDVELVARIVAGDQRAFAEIVRRHAGRLKALALGFSGAAGEAG